MPTKIEWTDETWNPVTGCTKVSAGCKYCYAERLWPKVEGARMAKVSTPDSETGRYVARPFTDVRCHHERLDAPLHWRKPRRVFVNSMSDLFHEDVPDEFIDKVFAAMALCSRTNEYQNRYCHQFQILTKRPARMLTYLSLEDRQDYIASEAAHIAGSPCATGWLEDRPWPLPNVWLGVSVEDQATADERIPLLLKTPAAIRFVSYEPALGQVDFTAIRYRDDDCDCRWNALTAEHWIDNSTSADCYVNANDGVTKLDWIIAGGESGPHARPAHPDWFCSVRDQCKAAGVPFFFKQWGEWVSVSEVAGPGVHHYFEDGATVRRVGKKLAGRLLDGVEYSEYPA